MRQVYDVGRKAVVAEGVGTGVGLPGAGTAGVVGSALAKGATKPMVAADKLITSPEFTKAVQVAIDGDIARANQIITNSPKYKEWSRYISSSQAEQIAALGFMMWLVEEQ